MSSKKALIVDDSMVMRLMIRKIVSVHAGGWDVLEADSADKASIMLESLDGLDIATLDQNMPGQLSGLDLAAIIKVKFPKAKIALITANIQDAIKDKANALGINFIEKPISEDKLKPFLDASK